MNFHEIVFSVSGSSKKTAYDALQSLNTDLLLPAEKSLLKEMLAAFEKSGSFLSYTYLCDKYGTHKKACKKISDLIVALDALLEGRAFQDTSMEVQEAVASSGSLQELQDNVSKVIANSPTLDVEIEDHVDSLEDLYEASKRLQNTFISGVPAIDEITSGFGEGLVSSVVAWTSHGKSAFWINAVHKNLQAGKKIVLISLEIPANIVYYQLLSRYSYELKKAIPYDQIVRRRLNAADQQFVFNDVLKRFRSMPGAVRVFDGVNFHKWDEAEIKRVLRKAEASMGGLDYVIVDHVNLFRYIDPNVSGDFYIKNFQQIAVSYRTAEGGMIGVGFAVQANREGWKRARANEGRYDMTAISEFREVERASTYVTFLYADEVQRAQNEALVHLQKHRIGRVMEDPEVTTAYYPCSVFGLDHGRVNAASKQSIMDGLMTLGGMTGSHNGEDDDFDLQI